ncbi:oxidative stress defense protein [Parashewanella curva]|uniref:Oxidative stress defense protein n=1 Tax=Parashewanella curva TaxID=2338552 RepID=A0A3L8PUM7_9GAMM|nr:oxidative stress defense protein [Parashewanella curva]RLV59111.1 oxidative stress defense protein [Parashewanella curva]
MTTYQQKLILLSAVLLSFLPATGNSTELNLPHIQTVGTSTVEVKADMATMYVSVSVHQSTAKQAKTESDKAVVALSKKLKKAGIKDKDIDSANVTVQPEYHYPQNQAPEMIGYKATRTVSVVVHNLNTLNTLLDSSIASGMNQINYIEYSSSQMDKYQEQARMAAIRDAQSKAKSLAKGFGEKLGRVWEINYSGNGYQDSMPRQAMMYSEKSTGKTYENKTITINDRVDVTYTLK